MGLQLRAEALGSIPSDTCTHTDKMLLRSGGGAAGRGAASAKALWQLSVGVGGRVVWGPGWSRKDCVCFLLGVGGPREHRAGQGPPLGSAHLSSRQLRRLRQEGLEFKPSLNNLGIIYKDQVSK